MKHLYTEMRASHSRQLLLAVVPLVLAVIRPVSAETQSLEWLPLGPPNIPMWIAAVPNSRHGDLAVNIVRQDFEKPQREANDVVYDRMEGLMEVDCRQQTIRPKSLSYYYHGRLVLDAVDAEWAQGWHVNPFPGTTTRKAFEQACNGKPAAD
jgi:hypothetical protein